MQKIEILFEYLCFLNSDQPEVQNTMLSSTNDGYVQNHIASQRSGNDDIPVPKPRPRPLRTLINKTTKSNAEDKRERKFAILADIKTILLHRTDTENPWVKPKEIYDCLSDKYESYYKNKKSFTAAVRCFVQERCFVKDCQHESKRWSGQLSRRRLKVCCYETPWILSCGQSRKGWRYVRSDELEKL